MEWTLVRSRVHISLCAFCECLGIVNRGTRGFCASMITAEEPAFWSRSGIDHQIRSPGSPGRRATAPEHAPGGGALRCEPLAHSAMIGRPRGVSPFARRIARARHRARVLARGHGTARPCVGRHRLEHLPEWRGVSPTVHLRSSLETAPAFGGPGESLVEPHRRGRPWLAGEHPSEAERAARGSRGNLRSATFRRAGRFARRLPLEPGNSPGEPRGGAESRAFVVQVLVQSRSYSRRTAMYPGRAFRVSGPCTGSCHELGRTLGAT